MAPPAARWLVRLAPLADFETRDGRLEIGFDGAPSEPHPAITLLRRLLAAFDLRCPEFGFYGTLAFDYYRLSQGDAIPDDGRRRPGADAAGTGSAQRRGRGTLGRVPLPRSDAAARRCGGRSRPHASNVSRTTIRPAAMPRRWRVVWRCCAAASCVRWCCRRPSAARYRSMRPQPSRGCAATTPIRRCSCALQRRRACVRRLARRAGARR